LRTGQSSAVLQLLLAIADVQTRLQLRAETVAEVADEVLALVWRVVLETVTLVAQHADVVVGVAHHPAGAELLLAISEAAALDAKVMAGRTVAGVGDEVDRTTQRQRRIVE